MNQSVRDTSSEARLRRSSAVFAMAATLLVASCGGGGEPAPAAVVAPSEASAAAEQVAAGDREAALAVSAAQATQARTGDPKRVRQVVVFGDSLSDVGTYRVGPVAQVGGGKYTTNPGPVWAETIGLLFGTRVTPYLQGGFGIDEQVLGGTGFAMGGARVAKTPGYRCEPDANGKCTRQLAMPVSQQIDNYLASNAGRFRADQLVFVQAGPNDIFYHLDLVGALAEAPQAALDEAKQAAIDLAQEVQRIAQLGGKRIVVLNVPPMADTPFGKLLGSSPQTQPLRDLLVGMVATFNGTLVQALSATGVEQMPGVVVAQLDLYDEVAKILGIPGAEINVPACDPVKIATITQGLETQGTSLFCSHRTLVPSFNPLTYVFADSVHPSTLTHLIVSRFIVVQLWRLGMI